jgi:hypothetical protein
MDLSKLESSGGAVSKPQFADMRAREIHSRLRINARLSSCYRMRFHSIHMGSCGFMPTFAG